MKTVKTLIALSIIAGNNALADNAKVYSGEVRAVNPTVSISSIDTPVAYVKDFVLEVQKDAIECDLKADRWEAENTHMDGAKPLCLFEWTGAINGLQVNDLRLAGVLDKADVVNFEYQVSILDKGEQTVLLTGEYSVDALNPELPEIVDVILKWTDADIGGNEQISYNKTRSLNGLNIEIAPQPYPQLVSYGEQECEIQENETSCSVSMPFVIPGDGEPEATGTWVDAFEVSDTKDYFTPVMETLSVDYDYRSPEVVDFMVNGYGEMTPFTHNVEGVDYTVEENEALIVMRSPHGDLDGTWWNPNVDDIALTMKEGISSSRNMEVNGKTYDFSISGAATNNSYKVVSAGEIEQVGDYFIGRYNISSLPDGHYTAKVEVTDDYNNSREQAFEDNLLDRTAPSIIGILGDVQIRSNSPVETYFVNELTFATHGGWDDGASIVDVTLDGEPVAFTRANDKVVTLENDDTLLSDHRYDYEVISEDAAGNQSSESFAIHFNPSDFRFSNFPDKVYQFVHELDVNFYQIDGVRCSMASSPELAQLLSSAMLKGCTVEFTDLPEGIEAIQQERYLELLGTVNELGQHDIGYSVVYHNGDGSTQVVYSGSTTLEVVEVPPIEVEMSDYNMISPGVYSVPYDVSRMTKFTLHGTNGAMEAVIESNGGEEVFSYSSYDNFGERSKYGLVNRLDDGDLALWEKVPYTLTARYPLMPDNEYVETFDAVITPHSQTKAYLSVETTEDVNSQGQADITMKVGVYDRKVDAYLYNPDTMGEWEARLGVYRDSQYIPFTDAEEVTESGEITFSIDAVELFEQGTRFVAMFDAINTTNGFESQLVSYPQYVKVLKGTAIEGYIDDEEIIEEIPFNTSLMYKFETYEDREVIGEATWEISTDGETWSDLESEKVSYYFRTEEPGTKYYRYRTVNAYTDVVSYSNAVKVVGFERAEFEIVGPNSLLENQVGEFSILDESDLVGGSEGQYDYSEDDGATWIPFIDSFEFSSSEDAILYVRNRLSSTDSAVGEESYRTERHVVKIQEPKPVRTDIRNVGYGEVDYALTLTAKAYTSNYGIELPIIGEIELPDGNVVAPESEEYEYVIKESDVVDGVTTFIYRAWVEGYKDETLGEDTVSVPTKHYIFPSATMSLSSNYSIAPATVVARLSGVYTDVSDVEFSYEWAFDSDVFSVNYDRGSYASFNILESGIHPVTVTVSDNRGNTRDYTTFLNIDDAPDMEVSIEATPDKENLRQPITIKGKARVSLGHPKDRVESWEWFVNDEITDNTNSYPVFNITEEGNYEFKLRITTQYGQVEERTFEFEILPNLPPICEPEIRESQGRRYVSHNCTDPDGELAGVSYVWEDGGSEFVYREVYFPDYAYPTGSVEITATDDGGEQVTYTVSW